MILIREETFDVTCSVVEDAQSSTKRHYISGPFLVAELKNKNGRCYPRGILEREVTRYQDEIKAPKAMGELGHPDTPNINLDRASHLITVLKFVDNNIVEGKARILNTPMGNIAQALLAEGIKLGVSSRGLGSLKMIEGVNMVQDDYHLATIDIVADPSGPGCFVSGLLEHKEWVWDAKGQIVEADLVQLENTIRKAKSKNLEQMTLEAFEQFIRSL